MHTQKHSMQSKGDDITTLVVMVRTLKKATAGSSISCAQSISGGVESDATVCCV